MLRTHSDRKDIFEFLPEHLNFPSTNTHRRTYFLEHLHWLLSDPVTKKIFHRITSDRIRNIVNKESNNFKSCVLPMSIHKVMLHSKE